MILWISSLCILEKMKKYVLRPLARLFYRFASLINIKVYTFFQTSFKVGGIFGANPDLIKSLACLGYF